MSKKIIQFDSISRDKNGKILVIVIDGKAITDPKEIARLMKEPEEEKEDVR